MKTCPLWLTTPSFPVSAMTQPPIGCTEIVLYPSQRGRNLSDQPGFLTNSPPSVLAASWQAWSMCSYSFLCPVPFHSVVTWYSIKYIVISRVNKYVNFIYTDSLLFHMKMYCLQEIHIILGKPQIGLDSCLLTLVTTK